MRRPKQSTIFSLRLKERPFWPVFVAVFITSTIAGFYVGRARSIVYADRFKIEKRLQEFVIGNARADRPLIFDKKNDDGGRLARLAMRSGNIAFVCSGRTFEYRGAEGTVRVRPTDRESDHAADAARIGRNAISFDTFDRTLGLVVGGSSAYAINQTVGKFSEYWQVASRESRIRAVVYTIAATASGFLIGFYLGYSDQPQCTQPEFQEALKDPVFWAPIYDLLKNEHFWSFAYSGKSPLPVVENPQKGMLAVPDSPLGEPDFNWLKNGDSLKIRSLNARPPGWSAQVQLLEPNYAAFSCLTDDLIDAEEYRLATMFNLMLSHAQLPLYKWLTKEDISGPYSAKGFRERVGGCASQSYRPSPEPVSRPD